MDELSRSEIVALIERARTIDMKQEAHLQLSAAHALRLAHLLDEMIAAESMELQELTALAVRPAIEATAFGLYYATHPKEIERSIVGADDTISRLAELTGSDYEPFGSGKGPKHWDHAFEEFMNSAASSLGPDTVKDLRIWHKSLSAQAIHSGLLAVSRYVDVKDGEPRPVPIPTFLINSRVAIGLVGSMLGMLLTRISPLE